MQIAEILTLIGVALAIIGTLFGTIFWTRGEANSVRSECAADRRELINLMIQVKDEINALKLEMRDFNHRIVKIEDAEKK